MIRRLMLAALIVGGFGLHTACSKSPEEQQKEREAAMIAQAQQDADAESEFRNDSLAIAKTFTLDTIVDRLDVPQRIQWEDDDGDQHDSTLVNHLVRGKRGKFCNHMEVGFWKTRVAGDTLTCQWADKVEKEADDQ